MPLAFLTLTIPLFFWDITANFFTTPKLVLLILFLLFLSFRLIYSFFSSHSLSFTLSRSNFFLILLSLATLLNLFIINDGQPEAISGRAGLLLILSAISILISFLPQAKKLFLPSFFVVAIILSLHSLLQLTWLYQAPFLPSFLQSRAFTPTGSFLTTLTLLLASLVAGIVNLRSHSRLHLLVLITIFLSTFSSVAIISLMLPGSPLSLNLLPLSVTWSIALDAIKNLRTALIGVGLANFAPFYSSVKPLFLNSTNLWNTLPQSGSSELLTLLTTGGLVLFLPFLGLILIHVRTILSHPTPLGIIFLVLAVSLIFTPANLVTYFFLFLLIPLLDDTPVRTLSLSPSLRLAFASLLLLIVGTLIYFLTRPLLADYYLRRGTLALANNDGKAVYEAHLATVRAYPQLASSRLTYAETNLRLASALSQKTDLTDADRSNISALIQQSIREGKLAVSLRPNYSVTWLSLGQIYRQLINVATGADKFAITAYAQAVSLDPANPSLRVDFGGLLFQLGESYYPRAKAEFLTAIQLKPDYANAYFNLAKLYEAEKDYPNSLKAMKEVAHLLPSDSPDASSVQTAISTLEKQQPAPSPTPSPAPTSDLVIPSPLPSPLPGGPIEIQ